MFYKMSRRSRVRGQKLQLLKFAIKNSYRRRHKLHNQKHKTEAVRSQQMNNNETSPRSQTTDIKKDKGEQTRDDKTEKVQKEPEKTLRETEKEKICQTNQQTVDLAPTEVQSENNKEGTVVTTTARTDTPVYIRVDDDVSFLFSKKRKMMELKRGCKRQKLGPNLFREVVRSRIQRVAPIAASQPREANLRVNIEAADLLSRLFRRGRHSFLENVFMNLMMRDLETCRTVSKGWYHMTEFYCRTKLSQIDKILARNAFRDRWTPCHLPQLDVEAAEKNSPFGSYHRNLCVMYKRDFKKFVKLQKERSLDSCKTS